MSGNPHGGQQQPDPEWVRAMMIAQQQQQAQVCTGSSQNFLHWVGEPHKLFSDYCYYWPYLGSKLPWISTTFYQRIVQIWLSDKQHCHVSGASPSPGQSPGTGRGPGPPAGGRLRPGGGLPAGPTAAPTGAAAVQRHRADHALQLPGTETTLRVHN